MSTGHAPPEDVRDRLARTRQSKRVTSRPRAHPIPNPSVRTELPMEIAAGIPSAPNPTHETTCPVIDKLC